MNERIKELVKQAGFFVLSNGKIYIPTTSEEITDCQIKFAKLIVRECVTKMALETMDNSWVDDAVKNTYEHFGVKE